MKYWITLQKFADSQTEKSKQNHTRNTKWERHWWGIIEKLWHCLLLVTKYWATSIINNCKEANCVSERRRNKRVFSNEPVKTLGTPRASIENYNWSRKNAHFVIVAVGLRPLIGRDLSKKWEFITGHQQNCQMHRTR